MNESYVTESVHLNTQYLVNKGKLTRVETCLVPFFLSTQRVEPSY